MADLEHNDQLRPADDGAKSVDTKAAVKKPFALRMSAQTMEALERWAGQEYRSVNGQIEFLLSKAIKEHFKKDM